MGFFSDLGDWASDAGNWVGDQADRFWTNVWDKPFSQITGALKEGVQTVSGYKAAKLQEAALEQQKRVMDQNLAVALRQERRSQEAIARANRRAPSIGAQLVGAMEAASAGGNRATMLRGLRPPRQVAIRPLVDPVSLAPSSGTLLGQ